jgi:hypothetical protein
VTHPELAFLHAGTILAAAGLAGLVVRRRAARCVFFAAYLVSVAATGLLVSLRPAALSWRVWLAVELLQGALAVGAAFEIAARILGRLPAAARSARRHMRAVVALTLAGGTASLAWEAAALRRAASPEALAYALASSVLPLLTYGAAFLFTALLAVANWYLLPLDPLHRAVLVGFSVYLVLFSALIVSVRSEEVRTALSRANSVGFVLLLTGWTWAAWRSEPAPPAPETLVRRLWPWR